MPEPGNPTASKTVAHGSLEELITPKLEPGRACLIVIRGRSVGMMVEVRERPVVVRRSPDVDLTIDDSAVSRRHAQIEVGPEGHVLTDLQSTNGIFVNGLRATRQALRDGDRIQVGTSTILKFCFQDDVEASFQKSLYDSAPRDGLTGAYNRKVFLETFEVDFSYAFKNGTALTLLAGGGGARHRAQRHGRALRRLLRAPARLDRRRAGGDAGRLRDRLPPSARHSLPLYPAAVWRR